jgi:UDP-N-acetylglucosamine:LPS N-acetylglucosamine transferase
VVLLFTIDAGGGHRAAARALVAAAEERQAPFELRVESFQQLLLPLDLLKRTTGLSLEAAYNAILRRRLSMLMVPLLRLMHGAILARRGVLVRTLVAWLEKQPRPQAVVSVFPNFNGVLRDALAKAFPGVPLVVVLTDFADFPPRFWIEPGLSRVVVGTPEAARQASSIGIPAERISQVSGMILHPRFHAAEEPDRRERVRAELGARPGDFTVTLLFGGKGSPEIAPLAQRLIAQDDKVRLITVCGDNPDLYDCLAPLDERSEGRLKRFGFTDRVSDLLAASDLLVTKPGPGSLSEAFQRRLPVVVSRDIHTIPQERFNTEFVERRGVGVVVHGWREIPAAVARLSRDPARLRAMRAALEALPENRAVYEVLEIIAREAAGHHGADCLRML